MANLTGFGAMQPPPPPGSAQAQAANANVVDPATGLPKASVVILEQPAENKLRFRSDSVTDQFWRCCLISIRSLSQSCFISAK